MAHTEAAEPRGGARGVGRFLLDLVIIVVIAFGISFLLKTFLLRSFYIPSGSMQQTLQISDHILVNQLVPNLVDVQRGDVVVFEDPGGWLNVSISATAPPPSPVQTVLQAVGLAADTSTDYVVKRVIGVGGDVVACCDGDGRVTVNGVPLDEPYTVIPEGRTAASALEFEVTVPEGAVWVMGDNRYSSLDSRYHQDQPGRGFVLEEEIVGRAFFVNWPFSHLAWLDNFPDTFTGVDEARGVQADGN